MIIENSLGDSMSYVKVTAEELKRRKKRNKIAKIALVVIILLLTVTYFILGIIYNGGRFTITLDPEFSTKSGIVLYDNLQRKNKVNRLYAKNIDFMDNISVNWLPDNLDSASDGPHNGDNYIAYTFYLANEGPEEIHYWVECYIDDVIKNVDEAVRVMIYLNGEKTIYAKKNLLTGLAEKGTDTFYSDDLAVLRQRKNFKPGDVDKYTVVIWLEGDDPDCVDALIGGEIKMHMDITEEHIADYTNKNK